VEHEGGSEYPVDVAGEVELTAIRAASVETVSGGHSKVGKCGDEANEASNHSGAGHEGQLSPVQIFIITKEMVLESAIDEGPARKEENDEANPKADAARTGELLVAHVDGTTGSPPNILKKTVATLLTLSTL